MCQFKSQKICFYQPKAVREPEARLTKSERIEGTGSGGELKKMLAGPTGLHHQDQKLFYKDSKAFLDTVGVKDKSKMVLQEDPINQEKRFLEMRKTAKMEKSVKFISEICLEVDRLGGQVSLFEIIISKGAKVDEKDITKLIELQLLKLDGVSADGNAGKRSAEVCRNSRHVKDQNCNSYKQWKFAPANNPKTESGPQEFKRACIYAYSITQEFERERFIRS